MRWRVGTWVRAGLTALVLTAWAGPAHGQATEQVREMKRGVEALDEYIRVFGTGLVILGIVGAVALVGRAAIRVYLGHSATTDPLKLAMSDSWIRAQLEKRQAATARSAPAEGTAPPPAEEAPAEVAELADDSDLAPITKA
jgi:hypothetical protein